MTMKVKAIEKKLKFTKDPNDAGVYRYVMSPEQYSSLNQKKVIKEAALRSGVSQGVMQACWGAAGEVIKAWATEGHSDDDAEIEEDGGEHQSSENGSTGNGENGSTENGGSQNQGGGSNTGGDNLGQN